MAGVLMSVTELRDKVEMSRGHIVKQHEIIARLRELGSDEESEQASAILVMMHEHLALEVEMLSRREAQIAKNPV